MDNQRICKAFNDTVKRHIEEFYGESIWVSYNIFDIIKNSKIVTNTKIQCIRSADIDDEHILCYNLIDLLTDDEFNIKDIIE